MNNPALQFEPTDEQLDAMRLHALTDRVLLIKCNLSAFTNRRRDTTATAELCQEKGAHSGSVSVDKIALSKSHLEPVTKAYSQLNQLINRHTSVWSGDGWRLIMADHYQAFRAKMQEAYQEMMDEVDNICAKWDQVIEENRAYLGQLFDRGMYPSAQEFRGSWGMKIEVMQVPSTDVRVAMDEASVRDLSNQIHQYVTKQYAGVLTRGMEQLAERVRHAADILSATAPEGKRRPAVYDSLLETVRDQATIMRSIATALQDKDMMALVCDIERDLLRYTTDQLRANPQLRDRVGATAKVLARRAERASRETSDAVSELSDELAGVGGSA